MIRNVELSVANIGSWGLVWQRGTVIGRVRWHADGSGFGFYPGPYNVTAPAITCSSLDALRDAIEAAGPECDG
jgi:hypothetical protein